MDRGRIIWLARHGERRDFVDPDWKASAQRPFDPPLTETGLAQARALGWRLAGERVGCVYTSPFLRTLQTACEVAEVIDAPVRIEQGLAEWLKADWFMRGPLFRSPGQVARRFPRVDAGYASRVEPAFPESWPEHAERAEQAVRALAEATQGAFLCVTHAAPLLAAVRGLLGNPRLEVGTDECSLTRLAAARRGWRLELNGDTDHLSEVGGSRLA